MKKIKRIIENLVSTCVLPPPISLFNKCVGHTLPVKKAAFTLSCKTFLSGKHSTSGKALSFRLPSLNRVSANASLYGFTLAEVLITLVVIGIIAAVTLPVLNNNLGEDQYRVPLKKVYATLSEAFDLTINNSFDYEGDIEINSKEDMRKFAKALAKNLSIKQYCCSDTTTTPNDVDCYGSIQQDDKCFVSTLYNISYTTSSKYLFKNSNFIDSGKPYGASFQLKDGTSVGIFPVRLDSRYCKTTSCWNLLDNETRPTTTTPLGVVVDINGTQSPNGVVLDTFAFIYTKSDGLLPMGIDATTTPARSKWMYTAKFLSE